MGVSIVPSPAALHPDAAVGPQRAWQLQCSSEVALALAAVADGEKVSHGFLLACSIHWVALVVTNAMPDRRVWLCDSYNRPLAQLRTLEQVQDLAAQHECSRYGFAARPV